MAVSDQNSAAQGGSVWEALKKRINKLVRKTTASNVRQVADELLSEDLLSGRGLFCSAILKSSASSSSAPDSGQVFASLVAAINSVFPDIGYLLLKRIVHRFKAGLDKPLVRLFAQLLNQGVVHEKVALQILYLLLHNPTRDNVQVGVVLIRECGPAVCSYSQGGIESVFEWLQEILHESGDFDGQIMCLMQALLSAMRKSGFSGYSDVPPELDLVEVDDQVTHEISLFNEVDPEMFLDMFRPDSHIRTEELML